MCALLPGGGYAQYAVVPEAMAMAIPESFSFEQAAAIPEVFLTALQTLFWIGKLKAKESVLVHAGASGVGTAAIQLAREAGARVIVTAGTDEKCETCVSLGADRAVNYKSEDFSREVSDYTKGRGVDLILDFVGASYWEKNLASLAMEGRLVIIAVLGGKIVERLDLGQIQGKRLQITGTTLRARELDYKVRLTRDFEAFAKERLMDGRLAPVIDSVFPWEEGCRSAYPHGGQSQHRQDYPERFLNTIRDQANAYR